MQTKKRTVLPADKWKEMKDGPGYWIMAEHVANWKKFILKICEKNKLACEKDAVVEVKETFDFFLDSPQDILKGETDETKRDK